jgi:hypothetical protein
MQRESRIESYRVRSPLLAMRHRDDRPAQFVTIPKGALIVLLGTPEPFEVVEIECDGQKFAIYNRDLEERAERVGSSSSQK